MKTKETANVVIFTGSHERPSNNKRAREDCEAQYDSLVNVLINLPTDGHGHANKRADDDDI